MLIFQDFLCSELLRALKCLTTATQYHSSYRPFGRQGQGSYEHFTYLYTNETLRRASNNKDEEIT